MFQIRRVLTGRGDADDLAAGLGEFERLPDDAAVSIVSDVIIDWTRMGFARRRRLPTFTSRVTRRG